MRYYQARLGGIMVVRRRLLALFAAVAVTVGLLTAVVVRSNSVSGLLGAGSAVTTARTVHWKPVPYHHLRVKVIPKHRRHGRSDKRPCDAGR